MPLWFVIIWASVLAATVCTRIYIARLQGRKAMLGDIAPRTTW
ncbi:MULTISPECIES: hypothetical protein [unclassified Streptomyces]